MLESVVKDVSKCMTKSVEHQKESEIERFELEEPQCCEKARADNEEVPFDSTQSTAERVKFLRKESKS